LLTEGWVADRMWHKEAERGGRQSVGVAFERQGRKKEFSKSGKEKSRAEGCALTAEKSKGSTEERARI